MILCYFFQFFCLVLGAVVMVGVTNFWLFLLLVPLTFVFIYARFYYMQTARDIKRIELAGRQAFYLVLLQNFDGITLRKFFFNSLRPSDAYMSGIQYVSSHIIIHSSYTSLPSPLHHCRGTLDHPGLPKRGAICAFLRLLPGPSHGLILHVPSDQPVVRYPPGSPQCAHHSTAGIPLCAHQTV